MSSCQGADEFQGERRGGVKDGEGALCGQAVMFLIPQILTYLTE